MVLESSLIVRFFLQNTVCSTNHKSGELDSREGNPRNFIESDYGDEEEDENYKYKFAGRALAVGRLKVPLFGDLDVKEKTKKAKKQRLEGSTFWASTSTSTSRREESKKKQLGEGGPTSVAVGGKYIVAGFSIGTLLHSPHSFLG